jgi:hypothetical protein
MDERGVIAEAELFFTGDRADGGRFSRRKYDVRLAQNKNS